VYDPKFLRILLIADSIGYRLVEQSFFFIVFAPQYTAYRTGGFEKKVFLL
jgi:hypothetical protein